MVSPYTEMSGRPITVHGPASVPVVERAISKCCSVVPTLKPSNKPAGEYTSAGSMSRSVGAVRTLASRRIGAENVVKSVVVRAYSFAWPPARSCTNDW